MDPAGVPRETMGRPLLRSRQPALQASGAKTQRRVAVERLQSPTPPGEWGEQLRSQSYSKPLCRWWIAIEATTGEVTADNTTTVSRLKALPRLARQQKQITSVDLASSSCGDNWERLS